eukprot:714272-Rhodomonas_salina.1
MSRNAGVDTCQETRGVNGGDAGMHGGNVAMHAAVVLLWLEVMLGPGKRCCCQGSADVQGTHGGSVMAWQKAMLP